MGSKKLAPSGVIQALLARHEDIGSGHMASYPRLGFQAQVYLEDSPEVLVQNSKMHKIFLVSALIITF